MNGVNSHDWIECVNLNEEDLGKYGVDFTNGGGYLEIMVNISNDVNSYPYNVGNKDYYLYVEVVIECFTYSNDTREPTGHPTIVPDYIWIIGEQEANINTSANEEFYNMHSEEFGSLSSSLDVNKQFLIVGECVDPWMTIKVVETDYDYDESEYKYVDIYINSLSLGRCLGLNHYCTHDWITCANAFYYDLSSIMNATSGVCVSRDCDSTNINVIDITFSIKSNVDNCPYAVNDGNLSNISYLFYTQVTLGCGFEHLNLSKIKLCLNGSDCSNQVLSNWDTIYCINSYSCVNSTIFNVNNVWCNQDYSCANSNFTSIINITCYQSYSCNGSTFDMINDFVDCDGYYSCANAIFTSVANVSCDGYCSCINAQFEGVNFISCNRRSCGNAHFKNINYVACNGWDSCEGAHFEAINSVACNQGCYYSDFKGIDYIYCDSCRYSDFDSINFIKCHYCANGHFEDIKYNGVTCDRDYFKVTFFNCILFWCQNKMYQKNMSHYNLHHSQ